MSAGLAPHDRRLRLGRYEVTLYSPLEESPSGMMRRRQLVEPARFATEAAARGHADELAADELVDGCIIRIDHIAPANSRYPDGPWHTARVEYRLDGR